MKRIFVLSVFIAFAAVHVKAADDGWISLFDGKTLDGWKASDDPKSFRVEDGMVLCDGSRSHLYYTGSVQNARFKNFEIQADVMTKPGANSGIYFHTRYQETGWPEKGFEVQVNNTFVGNPKSPERKKTGSLYAVRNLYKSTVKDDAWFTMRIRVQGKTIRVWVNDRLVVDYVEPDPPLAQPARSLSSGTFALQCHDPKSKVCFRNIRVMPLPDDLQTIGKPVEDAALDKMLTELARTNFPMVDFHVHLKEKFNLEAALAKSRKYGIAYGLAVNCGVGFPIANEKKLEAYADTVNVPETYLAMQAEGREWVRLFSKKTMSRFDYVFTDALTWTNDKGKRMRLWINEEVEVGEPEEFMNMYVYRILKILNEEPIDLFVNPTFLPEAIRKDYDALWTAERMDRVIDALAKKHIVLEINDRYRIPSGAFIKRAKAKGVKFAFGTNNRDEHFGNLEYCWQMMKECQLTAEDMYMPVK